jgi:hypothetical protein
LAQLSPSLSFVFLEIPLYLQKKGGHTTKMVRLSQILFVVAPEVYTQQRSSILDEKR